MIDIAQEFRRRWADKRFEWPDADQGLIGRQSWHDVQASIARRIAWLTAFDCDDRVEPELPALVSAFRQVAFLLDRRYRRAYLPPPATATACDPPEPARSA